MVVQKFLRSSGFYFHKYSHFVAPSCKVKIKDGAECCKNDNITTHGTVNCSVCYHPINPPLPSKPTDAQRTKFVILLRNRVRQPCTVVQSAPRVQQDKLQPVSAGTIAAVKQRLYLPSVCLRAARCLQICCTTRACHVNIFSYKQLTSSAANS